MGADTLVCKNCNKYNKYGAKICAFCGAALEETGENIIEKESANAEFKSFIGADKKRTAEQKKSVLEEKNSDFKGDFAPFSKMKSDDFDFGKTKKINISDLKPANAMTKRASKDENLNQNNLQKTNGKAIKYDSFKPASDLEYAKENKPDISFENEFELNDMSIDFGNENKMSDDEKITLRNTALIAMILAIVIDIALVIGMLVYFKGFANRIVNVSENSIEHKAENAGNVLNETDGVFLINM